MTVASVILGYKKYISIILAQIDRTAHHLAMRRATVSEMQPLDLDGDLHGMSLSEVAAVIGISRRHLQNLLGRGKGPPAVRLGGRVVVLRNSLRRWLAEQEA